MDKLTLVQKLKNNGGFTEDELKLILKMATKTFAFSKDDSKEEAIASHIMKILT